MDEELKAIKEAQENASKLLKDENAFNDTFEKIFKAFDKNKDGTIGADEYAAFFQLMIGGKKVNLARMMLGFDWADKDHNGRIDKNEFKSEVKKKLNEFIQSKPK